MNDKNLSATWIWYPGDFEIWLGNAFNNRRTERGAIFPPFWKQDSHWVTVEFSKAFHLKKAECIRIAAEGNFNLMLDGKLQFGQLDVFQIPAGDHKLNIKVHNQLTPPSLFIESPSLVSDSSWLATYEDKIWIDENGVSHGSGIYVPAACWNFNDIRKGPSSFRLARKSIRAQHTEAIAPKAGKDALAYGKLFDFGRETMGYVVLEGLSGQGDIHLYYGESPEEALDRQYCETLDRLTLADGQICDSGHNLRRKLTKTGRYVMSESKAFRFIYLEWSQGISLKDVSMQYEYLPQNQATSGSFRCSDEEINRIWEVGAYTMDLTTREFFMDGIKRDRWVWSGDAIQSYLMNYYLRFDLDCVRRTVRQLRGKDPVTAHINTIMDYTFYWFKSVYDYYQYSGDVEFMRELYPKMQTLMAYCLERTIPEDKDAEYGGKNVAGMAEGQSDDWIFVDWVDFPMHKRGVMCFEQILFAKSLETMQLCAEELKSHPLQNPPQGTLTDEVYASDAQRYGQLASQLRAKIDQVFWDEDKKAYLHNIEDGHINPMVTKFPNMFAINFGYADAQRQKDILENVMLNEDVEAITTPYMRFYELEALCSLGRQAQVLPEIKAYWGGMLREGATSFWEKYNPSESGVQHLAMYGRPYGKSLCHAWGASPIYLLGKYYLGIQPLKPGYEETEIRPDLGGLDWMEGDVPTPHGLIHLKMNASKIDLTLPYGKARLYFECQGCPKASSGQLEKYGQGQYCLCVEKPGRISVQW